MTATNGWPGKPGVPLNPERDGDHWLKSALTGEMYLFKWKAEKFYSCGQPQILPHWVNHPMWQVQEMIYLGPVLTPDEAAKREDVKWHEGYAVGVLDVRRGTAFGEPDTHYAALQKRVAGLEAALRPFADVGEFIAKHHPDPESDQNHETATLVRHFRAAYIALTGGKDE